MEKESESILKGNTDKIYSDLIVTVLNISPNGLIYYLACHDCKKKVIEYDNSYRCENCNIEVKDPNARYIYNMKVVDHSGELYLGAFNDNGVMVLGCQANEIRDLRKLNDEKKVNEILNKA